MTELKAPCTFFDKTLNVPIRTFTNNEEDIPPKQQWDVEMWCERGEDWYGLMAHARNNKVCRVITREMWIRAVHLEQRNSKNG